MNELNKNKIERLNAILLKATAERSCKWNLLSEFCVYTIIGNYGIFLNSYQDVILMNIYYLNHARITDIPRRELRELFYNAIAQVNWRNHLTADELIAFNMNATARKSQSENLNVDLYLLFNQP